MLAALAAEPLLTPAASEGETLKIVLAGIAVCGTLLGSLIGALVGSKLNKHAAQEARTEERDYAVEQRLAADEREAATLLDEALADAGREAGAMVRGAKPSVALEAALERFDPAYRRYTTRLTGTELSARMHAVNAFIIGAQVAAPTGTETIDFGLLAGLQRVVADARAGLEALRRDMQLPDGPTLSSEEIASLLREGRGGAPFESVRQWVLANPPGQQARRYLDD